MNTLSELLKVSQSRHSHLCPRQVLGVRMALAGLRLLELDPGKRQKDLMVIAETDGCFVDGLEVAAGVSIGHRSLRIQDYGKIAATFTRLGSEHSVRIHPLAGLREGALAYAPLERRAYFAQLHAYQVMSDEQLFAATWVTLEDNLRRAIEAPRKRIECATCGEEINNGREVLIEGKAVCAACAGYGYYQAAVDHPAHWSRG